MLQKGGVILKKLKDMITHLREEKKLNAKQMANELGFSYGTYWNWENGLNEPAYDKLIIIAKYHSVSTDYLLGLTEVRTPAEVEPMLKNINQEQKEAIKALLQLNSIQLAKAHGYILGLTSKNPNIFDL